MAVPWQWHLEVHGICGGHDIWEYSGISGQGSGMWTYYSMRNSPATISPKMTIALLSRSTNETEHNVLICWSSSLLFVFQISTIKRSVKNVKFTGEETSCFHQWLVLSFYNLEFLLGRSCPARDYISQHSSYLCGHVTELLLASNMKAKISHITCWPSE